ncbi:MAG: rhodanese-like domain-containing protein [Thiomicrospira sp.]
MLKKFYFCVLLLVPIWAMASGKLVDEVAGATKVSADQVLTLVDTYPNVVLIDSRKPEDRVAAGWIPGAVFLPNYETNEESLKRVLVDKSTPAVFYCNGPKCGRSGDAATKAVQLGYTKIYWFKGGWEEWTAAGLPAER